MKAAQDASRYKRLRLHIPGGMIWLIPAVSLLLVSSSIALQSSNPSLPEGLQRFALTPGEVAIGGFYPLVGAWILVKQPRNRVPWLLAVIGLIFAVSAFATQYVRFGPVGSSVALPLRAELWWLRSNSWIPGAALMAVLILIFPDGQLPSPRWRWLGWLCAGLIALSLAAGLANWGTRESALHMAQQAGQSTDQTPISSISDITFIVAIGLLVLSFPAAALGMISRYRLARGVERQQLKWFAYASSLLAAGLIGLNLIPESAPASVKSGSQILAVLVLTAPPVAIGVAVQRYRLYDIDLIIRRTLVYAAVSGLLGLVFFGSVVVFDSLLTTVIGPRSQIATVLSTLVIAALFTPLRQRVQQGVDRRFYRQRYDAERALAAFSAAVRDETDLDQMSAELKRVVRETVNPSQISLWLRQIEGSEP